jgi:rhamnogalacturonyl hydrolase YesR
MAKRRDVAWIAFKRRWISKQFVKTAAMREPAPARRLGIDRIENVTLRLLDYCRAEEWSGYDPYDALNSKVLSILPIFNAKWPRLALTQLLKRSPVNLRPLLQIPKTQNPKALALSLAAVIKLRRLGLIDEQALLDELVARIEATRSSSQYWCWGYSFPWQGRSIMVRRGEPNLICTTFVADALIDLFEETGDSRYLAIAKSAANYLLTELFWTDGKTVSSFGYPTASARSRVHNANLIAAAFLLRLHRHTCEERARHIAMEVASYSISCQRPDGSWPYGELANQQWIDNFHTGYNLCALRRMAESGEPTEFDENVDRGYQFYREHFFREDGAPRYFHNRTYPIDVHSAAQSIITLLEFTDRDPFAAGLARKVLIWVIDNLWDPSGYFYYRKLKLGTIKTSYMRWGQAWMLFALALFIEGEKSATNSGY